MSNHQSQVVENLSEELKKIGKQINGDHVLEAQRYFGVPGKPLSLRSIDRYLKGYMPEDTSFANDLLNFFRLCVKAQEVANKVWKEELDKLLEQNAVNA